MELQFPSLGKANTEVLLKEGQLTSYHDDRAGMEKLCPPHPQMLNYCFHRL